MRAATLDEITHNARLTMYPSGRVELLCSDSRMFREPGWESRDDDCRRVGDAQRDDRQQCGEDVERARRRARAAVRELARCNDFSYFVTLTLDPEKVNRYEYAEVVRKLNRWLSNQVQRRGLLYVLVPELHKDGAIHFHGLINDALPVVDSGTISGAPVSPINGTHSTKPRRPRSAEQRAEWLAAGGHVVYNLPGWTLGFTTAIRLYGDPDAAISYVCKYIGKGSAKVGGRWFLSGGKLQHPEYVYTDVDFADYATPDNVFNIDRLGARCCRVELEKGANHVQDS